MYLGTFKEDCEKFNDMYKLSEQNGNLQYRGIERLAQFVTIFTEELAEVNNIFVKMAKAKTEAEQLEVMTDLSDWLGDLVVYCSSEAGRWGLPMADILQIIMQSNFSKLDADGKPIYDERGKVMKGSNYWKPEPKIKSRLEDFILDDLSSTNNIVFA